MGRLDERLPALARLAVERVVADLVGALVLFAPDVPDGDPLALFAALTRLPASVAAIGTMAVPVIGVLASAAALHEPLGPTQIIALLFTLAGVALATRS